MTDNEQTISVELPETIFRRLQHIAEVTHRSIEDVLATTVDVALPQTPGVPDEVADDLAALTLCSDRALWTVAKTSFAREQQQRLSQLAEDGEAHPLDYDEATELTQLIDTYDRAILRRAKAMALLAQRGFDVSSITNSPFPHG